MGAAPEVAGARRAARPTGSCRNGRLALLFAAAAAGLVLLAAACGGGATATPSATTGDAAPARAFRDHVSGVEVRGEGAVVRLLPDDLEGGRHQRFILELASGQTVLVAHNIDVAPRLDGLAVGDHVAFRGVYEWNAEGGVVHWTHHDPSGAHPGGWLRYDGRVFD